ncbi:MAG TPA: hypothetical protein VJ808_13410 [Gemmatimonadales bacterium]|nr:hypothetical protein [Gemmatimonadales bacterium]
MISHLGRLLRTPAKSPLDGPLWPEYLDDAHDSLTEKVSYSRSKGDAWTNTVEEILTQGDPG